MSDERTDCIDLLDSISKAQTKKEIDDSQGRIIKKLKDLKNFKSDLYEPLSLAVQLLSIKKQDLSNSRQFIINILLALSAFLSATIIGIIQISRG